MPAGYSLAPHKGKPGYHDHVYPGGRRVAVKGDHSQEGASAGGGGTAAATSDTGAYGGGIPVDPAAENTRAVNQQQLAIGQAQDVYDTKKLSNEYGIGDTSNPYSRARLLEQTFQRNQGSSLNSMASKGQLYSGALQTKLNDDQNTFNRGNDQLQRQYADSLNSITQRKTNRYASANQQMDDSTYNSIIRALG